MNLGVLTDDQGRYTLVIPASRATGEEVVVTVKLIRYTSIADVVTLNPGTINLNFGLAPDPQRLDEIVVVGMGLEVQRSRLGVAMNSVEAEEIMLSQEYNVVSALAGKAPNMEVTTSAGDPGAGASIRIGARTPSWDQPAALRGGRAAHRQ